MKKFKLVIFFIFLLAICCFAQSEYNVFVTPKMPKIKNETGMQTLLILDYSNSMNEMLIDKTKYYMLLDSLKSLLPQIAHNKIGVRIYGHRWGFTPIDACRASSLVVPISSDSAYYITDSLRNFKPRGMTPITYSLKQAVKNDFVDDSRDKHIVLITDGGENCDESPCKYAMELIKYRKDIKIDVIALNLDNEEDLDQLRCTANVTGGKLYSANTQAELVRNLENAFGKAAKRVDAKLLY